MVSIKNTMKYALVLGILSWALPTLARGGSTTYNCKRDKVVEVPGQLQLSVKSGTALNLQMIAGSDAAGISASGYQYRIVDSLGQSTSLGTHIRYCYSTYVITDGTLTGLIPGMTYSLSLISHDACGNVAESTPVSVTMPALVSEANKPVIKTNLYLDFLYIWGSAFNPSIAINVDDDTAVDRVEFFVDGQARGTDHHSSGLSFYRRAAGEMYKGDMVMDLNKTGSHLFEAHVYDLFGNVTVISRTISVDY